MADRFMPFQAYLDSVFFPGKKKPKKRDKGPDPRTYLRADLTEEACGKLPGPSLSALYLDSEYPEMILTGLPGTGDDEIARRFAALFDAKPTIVTEAVGDRQKALLAFRADSYLLFSPPPENPAHPTILVKKNALKPIEDILNLGKKESKARPEQSPAPETWSVSNPAELLASRLFLPPRTQLSGYAFAARPVTLAMKPDFPQNTRTRTCSASWKFAGHPLSARYHLSFLPSDREEQDKAKIAIISAFFREALGFWAHWKRPIEAPSFSESRSAVAANSIFMTALIGGEGQQFRCTVEIPQGIIALILMMNQTKPLAAGEPAGIIDLIRANEALFAVMQPLYRKPFLSPSPGPVQLEGLTIHGLLSIADEVDRSIIIQNFLIPRYELVNLPLFFYYHEVRTNADGETVYRLRPAFPLTRGEIERMLSDAQKREWQYTMSKGCGDGISSAGQLAKLNAEAVLRLAQEGAAGKVLLTAKTMQVLRSEILAPLEAELQRDLDEANKHTEAFDGLKGLHPRTITEMLARIDTRTLALACTGWTETLKLLERGMSKSRRSDIQTEIEVIRMQRARGEIPVQGILDAKGKLVSLAREYGEQDGEIVG